MSDRLEDITSKFVTNFYVNYLGIFIWFTIMLPTDLRNSQLIFLLFVYYFFKSAGLAPIMLKPKSTNNLKVHGSSFVRSKYYLFYSVLLIAFIIILNYYNIVYSYIMYRMDNTAKIDQIIDTIRIVFPVLGTSIILIKYCIQLKKKYQLRLTNFLPSRSQFYTWTIQFISKMFLCHWAWKKFVSWTSPHGRCWFIWAKLVAIYIAKYRSPNEKVTMKQLIHKKRYIELLSTKKTVIHENHDICIHIWDLSTNKVTFVGLLTLSK